ncbi:lipopolysaccharide biosynthesis protein, partial [Rhodospirillum rubrum]
SASLPPPRPGRAVRAMVYGAGAALVVRGLEVGGKFLLYFLVARFLGASEGGLFFLCLTWAHVLSTLTRFGLDRALILHVSSELAVDRRAAAARDVRLGLLTSGGLALIVALLSWSGADLLERHVFSMPGLAPVLAMASLAIVPQTVNVMLCAVLVGLGRSVIAQFLQNAWWPLVLLALVGLGLRSAGDLLAGFAVAGVSGAGLCLALIRRERRRLAATPTPRTAASAGTLTPLLITALPLGVVEVVQVSLSNLPVLLLGVVAAAGDVAAFSIANRMTQLVWVVLISLGTIAAPRIGAAYRLGDFPRLRSLNRTLQALGALTGGLAALVMIGFASPLLGLVGDGYESAAAALVVMAAGQVVNAVSTGQDVILAMTGHGKMLRQINLVQLGVCVVCAIVLIAPFGMMGAAIASALPLAIGATLSASAVSWILPAAPSWSLPLPAGLARVLFGSPPTVSSVSPTNTR